VDEDGALENPVRDALRWVARQNSSEPDRVLQLTDELAKTVVHQDHVLESISRTLLLARSGLTSPDRVTASFLFLGKRGVGKSHVCRELARFLFDDESALISLDMSEYMEKHNASRLVGSPPGYVGYDDGGTLTQAVRQRPGSIVLLREIEKAHPDVFEMLSQCLNRGYVTDTFGRDIDFRNVIFVMLSNVGVDLLSESNGLGFTKREAADLARAESGGSARDESTRTVEAVLSEVDRYFRPEFLSRLDDIIVFNDLDEDALVKIVSIELGEIAERLSSRGVRFEPSSGVAPFVARDAMDKRADGTHAMRDSVKRHVLDPIARLIVEQGGTLVGTLRLAVTDSPGSNRSVSLSLDEERIH
jgi:ATP-dependent Clp protease ATP-binding subunit ClpC